MLKKSREISNWIYKNIRYGVAAAIFVTILVANNSFLRSDINLTNADECPVKSLNQASVLSRKKNIYQLNNIINSEKGDYYRLVFKGKADKDTSIRISLSGLSSSPLPVKTLEIKKSEGYNAMEAVFSTPDVYSDLIFEKTEDTDTLVYLTDYKIERLKISSDKELSELKPIISGWPEIMRTPLQIDDATFTFNQLRERNVLIGQIFQSNNKFISAVELGITKEGTGGEGHYNVQLHELEMNNGTPRIIDEPLAQIEFSACDIESYRQKNGNVVLPLVAKVSPEKKYLLALDNSDVETNSVDYLSLKGSSKEHLYNEGGILTKSKQKWILSAGDLYVIIHGGKFKVANDKVVVPGSLVEEIGKGEARFTYQDSAVAADLLNIEEKSPDVSFNSGKNVVLGKTKQDSYYTFAFNTFYPIEKFIFKGNQFASSHKVKVHYSFNKKDWKEIPYASNTKYQLYNATIEGDLISRQIYVKIMPDLEQKSEKKIYGLKGLMLEAKLKTN